MNLIYMSKNEVLDRFEPFFNAWLSFEFSNLKTTAQGFCQFFENEKQIVVIKQVPTKENITGGFFSRDLEKLKENIVDEIYKDLQEVIISRREQLDKYEKSNILFKSTVKISALLSGDSKKSDYDYVKKAVSYLETKTKEDIRNKLTFAVNYFNEENESEDCCVILPQKYNELLSINYLYLSVLEDNYLPKGTYVLNVEDVKHRFVEQEDTKLVITYTVKEKSGDYFLVKLDIEKNEEDGTLHYEFNNGRTYHHVFMSEEESLTFFLEELEKRKKMLNQEIEETKEKLNVVKLVGDLNQTKRLSLKN